MKHAEVENIAKKEVMEFLFSRFTSSYDDVQEALGQDGELPKDAVLWSFFSEYDAEPGRLANFMQGMFSTFMSFAYRVEAFSA